MRGGRKEDGWGVRRKMHVGGGREGGIWGGREGGREGHKEGKEGGGRRGGWTWNSNESCSDVVSASVSH